DRRALPTPEDRSMERGAAGRLHLQPGLFRGGVRMDERTEVTELLARAQSGDAAAADALFRATYHDLHRLAHARLGSNRRDALLDTTALVHEWFVRFARAQGLKLEDRRHFMRYAGRAMRSIIVDFARERAAARRGGGVSGGQLPTELRAPA